MLTGWKYALLSAFSSPLGLFRSSGKEIALLLFVCSFISFISTSLVLARQTVTHVHDRTLPASLSFEEFERQLSLGAQKADICAWENDLGFFLSHEHAGSKSERVSCADRLGQHTDLVLKDNFTNSNKLLHQEIQALVVGFPMETMALAIAHYDREIAGLLVGIGKKESNWGKHTPKLAGDECFNFWGYRGAGSRGLTSDGYGCWNSPEEAVKTVGDRLVTLRTLRASAEPARMVVWKCGSSCAGHSDESVRKWIADVDHYYRAITRN